MIKVTYLTSILILNNNILKNKLIPKLKGFSKFYRIFKNVENILFLTCYNYD